jgi:hypothetical protein
MQVKYKRRKKRAAGLPNQHRPVSICAAHIAHQQTGTSTPLTYEKWTSEAMLQLKIREQPQDPQASDCLYRQMEMRQSGAHSLAG